MRARPPRVEERRRRAAVADGRLPHRLDADGHARRRQRLLQAVRPERRAHPRPRQSRPPPRPHPLSGAPGAALRPRHRAARRERDDSFVLLLFFLWLPLLSSSRTSSWRPHRQMALVAPRFLFVFIRQFFSFMRPSPRTIFSCHRYRKNLQQSNYIERCGLGSLLHIVLEGVGLSQWSSSVRVSTLSHLCV